MHLGVLRGVLSALGFDDAHAALGKGLGKLFPGLFAQFVAVAQEQGRLVQAPGLVQPPQQVGGDHSLARAGGEAQQHAHGLAGLLAAQDLGKGGTDGGVLVVARLGVGGAVGHEKHGGIRLGNVDTGVARVTCRQIDVRREVGKRKRAIGHLANLVEFAVAMAIGGKDVLDMKARAVGVALGLLHALQRVFGFGLGLDHTDRKWRAASTGLHAEEVVGAADTGPAAALVAGRLDRCGSFELELPVLVVALVAQDRVDQVEAGFGFVVAHALIAPTCGWRRCPAPSSAANRTDARMRRRPPSRSGRSGSGAPLRQRRSKRWSGRRGSR
jgi:hypothetical protein